MSGIGLAILKIRVEILGFLRRQTIYCVAKTKDRVKSISPSAV